MATGRYIPENIYRQCCGACDTVHINPPINRYNDAIQNYFHNLSVSLSSDGGTDCNATLAKNPSIDYTISLTGDYNEKNRESIEDINKLLNKSGAYKEVDRRLNNLYTGNNKHIGINLDNSLEDYIAGITDCSDPYYPCDITLNPKIFPQSYMNIENKDMKEIMTYLQAMVLLHEYIHKETMKSLPVNAAAYALAKMGHKDKIREVLEMIALTYTDISLDRAGISRPSILDNSEYMPPGYHAALDAGMMIEKKYGSLENYIWSLAAGKISSNDIKADLGAIYIDSPEKMTKERKLGDNLKYYPSDIMYG